MTPCPSANPTKPDSPVMPITGMGSGVLAGLGIARPSMHPKIIGSWVIDQTDTDPIGSIERIINGLATPEPSSDSGWLIMLSYELGRTIEPKAGHDRGTQIAHLDGPTAFPLAVAQRWVVCDSAEEHSEQLGKMQSQDFGTDQISSFSIGAMESSLGKAGYIKAVERTKEYIRAGDIYQANIAHHLSGSFVGCARSCFEDLRKSADPKFGSMMIFDHDGHRHAVLSISPELFVEFDPQSRIIRTEPMKGTRPIGSDEAELRDSVKDRAELDMITDLMRNDLGRVCDLGSVRVTDPRRIESHQSGVLQASAVIEGKLVGGADLSKIINATFPPGSVTGVPKVRAMQVIDELENHPRDSYCGAMIVLDDLGSIKGSVSIRTAHIWGEIDPGAPDSIKDGRFVYPVGAGVVADSDPESEWAETLIKAAVLRSALGAEIR